MYFIKKKNIIKKSNNSFIYLNYLKKKKNEQTNK